MQIKYKIAAIIFVFCFSYTSYLFAQNKQLRIISLAPATTEILFALGLDKEIVGVSEFCNYPKEAEAKEKIGTFSRPNIEKILSIKPDLIFCTGLEQSPVIAKLKQLNLNIFVSDPKNINELFQSIREIGKLTNKEKESTALIDSMRIRIEKINSQVSRISKERKQKVFIEIWYSPLTTVGRGSFINELIEFSGGVNITSDIKSAYSSVTSEVVLKRNPDCIILAYMGNLSPIEQVMARPGWNNIAAVKNKRVYNDIDPDTLLRPGPRIVEALYGLHKKLYPDE
ncbi:MAG: cobalamin-binding protein [Candidatus Omnitrophica bacterium]|jgi:iron complex transport system substrate-binding protein|nr:cobalamin-binding protein [Candidatus Omnitrophota bacterium]